MIGKACPRAATRWVGTGFPSGQTRSVCPKIVLHQKEHDPIQSDRIMIQDADSSTLVPFSKTKLRSRGDRSFFQAYGRLVRPPQFSESHSIVESTRAALCLDVAAAFLAFEPARL